MFLTLVSYVCPAACEVTSVVFSYDHIMSEIDEEEIRDEIENQDEKENQDKTENKDSKDSILYTHYIRYCWDIICTWSIQL